MLCEADTAPRGILIEPYESIAKPVARRNNPIPNLPGTYRRLIKLRKQIRNEPKKIVKPNVLEVVI